MYYKINNDNAFDMFLLNGEFVGVIQEADTDEGYIKRYEYNSDKPTGPLSLVTLKGRVDYIGDSEKDLPEVLNARLHKIRSELGLEPWPDIFLSTCE